MRPTSKWLSVPVTALAFVSDNRLLAGQGPNLLVIELPSRSTRSNTFLHDNRVHRIVVGPNGYVLLVGGHEIVLLQLEEAEISLIHRWRMPDWIHDAAFLLDHESSLQSFYAITAHNTCYRFANSSELIIESQVACLERPFLWSCSFDKQIYQLEDTVQVANGTIMYQVLVWEPVIHGKMQEGKPEVLKRWSAHTGSVFHVKFAHNSEMVASCSDDRSLRIYRDEEDVDVRWGHEHRVWRVAWSEDNTKIVTVGEDLRIMVWSLEHSKPIANWKAHDGRSIWSVAIHGDYVASGGADGEVKIWRIPNATDAKPSSSRLDSQSTQISLPEDSQLAYLQVDNDDTIFALTLDGDFYSHSINNKEWRLLGSALIPVSKSESFTISNFQQSGTTFTSIINRAGQLVLVDTTTSEVLRGQLDSFALCSSWYHSDGNLFLATVGDAIFTVYRVSLTKDAITFESTKQIDLASNFKFVTGLHVSADASLAVIRNGSGFVTCISLLGEQPLICQRVHTDSITDLHFIDFNTVESICKDGFWKRWRVVQVEDTWNIEILATKRVVRGALDAMIVKDDKLYFGSFASNKCLIIDQAGQRITSWECRNPVSQRFWTSTGFYQNLKGQLVVQRIELASDNELQSGTTLSPGLHGRETRAVAIQRYQDQLLCATGAENGVLKISLLNLDTNTHRVLHADTTIAHSFQSAKLMKQSENEFLLFISGSRNMLACIPFSINREHVETKSISTCPKEVERAEVRVMDIDVVRIDGRILMLTVYSDGIVRLWEYTNKLVKFGECFYRDRCILSCAIVDDPQEHRLLLLAGATDGSIAMWSFGLSSDSLTEPALVLNVHQSGVNCIDSRIDSTGQLVIASGGDDNSFTVVFVNTDGMKEVGRRMKADAHASSLKGITLLNDDTMVTTSTDQKVKQWQINNPEGNLGTTSFVADIGAMDVLDGLVAVAGIGVEVFQVL